MQEFLNAIAEPLMLLITAVLTYVVALVALRLREKTGIEIDTIFRDRLHGAIVTHLTAWLTEKIGISKTQTPAEAQALLGGVLTPTLVAAATDAVLQGLQKSNPDTLKHFNGVGRELLQRLVEGVLPQVVGRVRGEIAGPLPTVTPPWPAPGPGPAPIPVSVKPAS